MHLLLALAAIAAGTASPSPATAAQCEAVESRKEVLRTTLGRSELLTRIANAGLAPERAIAVATSRSRSSDREAAGRALRLLSDPAFTAEQARMEARIDQVFDRVVAALNSPDEAERCRTVVRTLVILADIESENIARAEALASRLETSRMADAR